MLCIGKYRYIKICVLYILYVAGLHDSDKAWECTLSLLGIHDASQRGLPAGEFMFICVTMLEVAKNILCS